MYLIQERYRFVLNFLNSSKDKGIIGTLKRGIRMTKEVIIATNPSVEGEATSIYISKLLKPLGVKVSRLAYGIPAGAELEYTDDVTLLRALEGRQEI